MAKKGMARPEWTHTQPRNDAPPVPEIRERTKGGGGKPNPPPGGPKHSKGKPR